MLAAEALVPARAFQGDSAMRQRLMARLENMPGSSTAAAGLAHAQPGSSGAAMPVQATAAPLTSQMHSASIPDGNGQAANSEYKTYQTGLDRQGASFGHWSIQS